MKLKNEETKYHGFDLPVFLICEPGLRAGRGGFRTCIREVGREKLAYSRRDGHDPW